MKKAIRNTSIIIVFVGILVSTGIAYCLFKMPHRNIQKTKTDYTLTASELVKQYLTDSDAANQKYLDENGESKILKVTGTVFEIRRDLNNQNVVVLKSENEKAGVSCTFAKDRENYSESLAIGATVTVKGVIRSGAGYDSDLDLYEDVIMEKCILIVRK